MPFLSHSIKFMWILFVFVDANCDIFFRLLLGGSKRLTLIICRILPLNLRHEPCIHALLIDKYDAIYRSHSHPSAKFVFSSSLFAHSQIVSISLCIHLSNIWWFLFLFSQPRSKKWEKCKIGPTSKMIRNWTVGKRIEIILFRAHETAMFGLFISLECAIRQTAGGMV